MFKKFYITIVISGKTMENERERVDVKLVYKWNGCYGAKAYIAKPNFHSCNIIDENLVAIQLNCRLWNFQKSVFTDFTTM